jgi:hypothetical protein
MPTRHGGPYRDERPALRARIEELERVRADAAREIATLRERMADLAARRLCARALRALRVLRAVLRYVLLPTACVALAVVAALAWWEETKDAFRDGPESAVICEAAERYAARHGECPSVATLISARRLDADYTSDPWGGAYEIECSGSRVIVRSAGPDRRVGTEDDISSARGRRNRD